MDILQNGFFVVGQFIELTREERVDRESGVRSNVDYAIISTGGRRGIIALKFSPESISREAFGILSDAKLGDCIFAKVRVQGFNNAVYFTLEDVSRPDVA